MRGDASPLLGRSGGPSPIAANNNPSSAGETELRLETPDVAESLREVTEESARARNHYSIRKYRYRLTAALTRGLCSCGCSMSAVPVYSRMFLVCVLARTPLSPLPASGGARALWHVPRGRGGGAARTPGGPALRRCTLSAVFFLLLSVPVGLPETQQAIGALFGCVFFDI